MSFLRFLQFKKVIDLGPQHLQNSFKPGKEMPRPAQNCLHADYVIATGATTTVGDYFDGI